MNNQTTATANNADIRSQIQRVLIKAHPSVLEVGERRRAELLATITLILTIPLIIALFSQPRSYDVFLQFIAVAGISYILSRSRLYRWGAYIFTFSFTSIAFLRIYQGTANTVESSITTTVHISLIFASVILSRRGFVLLAILSTLATFTTPLYSNSPLGPEESLGRTGGLVLAIGAILIGINTFRASVEKERLEDLRTINTELEDIKTNLEQRVEERTTAIEKANNQTTRRAAQLQAVTQLSESIAQFQDLGELFPAVTRLISDSFGFYHVGIFLIDSERKNAMMQAANSEGGERMLARSHSLKLGTGVVGYAAQTGLPRIALDVGADAVFFDNPDLPDTRSEAALPLKSRDETIGVLDVQSLEARAFSQEDLQVLLALANQVSIALENARLLNETRAALSQVQEVYDEFTRTEWTRTIARSRQTGFQYRTGRIETISEPIHTPDVLSAALTGKVATNQANGSKKKRSTMAIPVKLRGEVIGVIQLDADDASKTWQADEISLVEAVADRAAYALENARLFQDARRRASKERLISEATSRISDALNIENILQTTAQELERVFSGSEVLIRLQPGKEQS